MIELRCARTLEVDEIEEAVDELVSGIDLATLKANNAGLIFCHVDFIESGVLQALYERLGFEIIGMTSTTNATVSGYDMYGLSLTVFTSDDVRFTAAMTTPLESADYEEQIRTAWEQARSQLTCDPELILTFVPFTPAASGAVLVDCFDRLVGGIPFWGSIPTSVEIFYDQCFTICNDTAYSNGFAMLLFEGAVEPHFVLKSLPDRQISERQGEITKCEGSHLYEINDMTVVDYLNSFGFEVSENNIPNMSPLLVYYKGTTQPVALGIYTVYADGSVLTGGFAEVGDIVAIGSITPEGVLETAASCIEEAAAVEGGHGALFLPCVTRFHALAPDNNAELELMTEQLNAYGLPFAIGYAGGEICPTVSQDGTLKNRFHNFTMTACVLQ